MAFHPVRAAGDRARRRSVCRPAMPPAPDITMHWLPPAPQDPKAHHSSSLFKGVRGKDDEFALMARRGGARRSPDCSRGGRLRVEAERVRALRPGGHRHPHHTPTTRRLTDAAPTLARAGIGRRAPCRGRACSTGDIGGRSAHTCSPSLIEPDAPGRFRAALATTLLGCDAGVITMLAQDEEQRTGGGAAPRSDCRRWVSTTGRMLADTLADPFRTGGGATGVARGPLPALLPFITDAAPRWLRRSRRSRDDLPTPCIWLNCCRPQSAVRVTRPAEQLQWFAQQRAQAARAGRAGVGEDRQLRMEVRCRRSCRSRPCTGARASNIAVVVLPFVAHGASVTGSAAAWRSRMISSTRINVRRVHGAARGVLEPAACRRHRHRGRTGGTGRGAAPAVRRADPCETRAARGVEPQRHAPAPPRLYRLLHAGAKTGPAKRITPDRGHACSAQDRSASPPPPADSDRACAPSMSTTPLPTRLTRIGRRVESRKHRRHGSVRRRHLSADLHACTASPRCMRAAKTAKPVPRARCDRRRPGRSRRPGSRRRRPSRPAIEGGLGGTAFGNAVHDGARSRRRRTPGDAHLRSGALRTAIRARGRTLARYASATLLERALLPTGTRGDARASRPDRAVGVARASTCRLPGDVRLCDLAVDRGWCARLAVPLPSAAPCVMETPCTRCWQSHGYPRARTSRAGGALEGLMHGYIDLVYRDAARQAITCSTTRRIVCPPTIRTVCVARCGSRTTICSTSSIWSRLRRWLQAAPHGDGLRRRASHLGGAVYLFLRGIDLSATHLSAADPQALSSGQAEVSRAGRACRSGRSGGDRRPGRLFRRRRGPMTHSGDDGPRRCAFDERAPGNDAATTTDAIAARAARACCARRARCARSMSNSPPCCVTVCTPHPRRSRSPVRWRCVRSRWATAASRSTESARACWRRSETEAVSCPRYRTTGAPCCARRQRSGRDRGQRIGRTRRRCAAGVRARTASRCGAMRVTSSALAERLVRRALDVDPLDVDARGVRRHGSTSCAPWLAADCSGRRRRTPRDSSDAAGTRTPTSTARRWRW